MRTKYSLAHTLLFTLSLVFQANAQSASKLSNVARSEVQAHRIAGVAVARIEDSKIVELFSVNNNELQNQGINDGSVFQVGSISKPVTAWAILTLVRDGKVKLDDSIWQHVSRWQVPDSPYSKEKITIRRLLSHSAGLSLGGYPGFKESEELPSIEESLSGKTNHAGDVHLFQEPGTGFQYSGGGYTLLQLLIEEVSGVAFHQYLEQAVLSPLGMSNSSYLPSAEVVAKRSQAYRVVDQSIPQFHFRARAAAGLHSTAEDLAKFVIANISANPVLSADLLEQMHSASNDAGFADIGLGFFIWKKDGLIGHGGSNLGWRAGMVFDKSAGSGLVILTNSERGERLIPTLKCAWQTLSHADNTRHSCQTELEKRKRSAQKIALVGNILLVISAAILAFSIWLKFSQKPVLDFTKETTRRGLIILVLVLLGSIAAIMHTPIGAYLVSGFWGIFSTLHYAPMGTETLLLGIYSLMFGLIALIIAVPRH